MTNLILPYKYISDFNYLVLHPPKFSLLTLVSWWVRRTTPPCVPRPPPFSRGSGTRRLWKWWEGRVWPAPRHRYSQWIIQTIQKGRGCSFVSSMFIPLWLIWRLKAVLRIRIRSDPVILGHSNPDLDPLSTKDLFISNFLVILNSLKYSFVKIIFISLSALYFPL